MQKLDLEKIVVQNNLSDFILGQGEYVKHRPEDFYAQWNRLRRYYKKRTTPFHIKEQIKATVLCLFDSPDVISKEVSLDLCRVMNIYEIREKIILFLKGETFEKLDSRLQNSLMQAVAYFEIDELKDTLIMFIIKNANLGGFLLWHWATFDTSEITQNGIWKISILRKYYNKSNPTLKQMIITKLKKEIDMYTNVRTAINAFVENTFTFDNEFDFAIKEILHQSE